MRTLQPTRTLRSRVGLTLLELVMVVSILAILTALVVPGMTDQSEQTRQTVARATMQELRDVIANRYLQDMGALNFPQPNALDVSGRISTTLQLNGTVYAMQPQMHFLFVNPMQYDSTSVTPYAAVTEYDSQSRIGWNGPYVMTKSTTFPNPANKRFTTDPNNTKTWSDYGFSTLYGQAGDFTVMDPWGSPYVIVLRFVTHGGSPLYTANVVSAGFNRQLETTADGTATTGDDLLLPIKSWK